MSLMFFASSPVRAQAPAPEASASAPSVESWAWHVQATSQTQWHPRFRSPYAGTNSLPSAESALQTADVTLFLGMRPWAGGELYVAPEIDQGHGLADTLGLAGFPSGDAYKVGRNEPYWRLPRAFLRQVVPLGDTTDAVESAPNALAGPHPVDNLTLTVGKFSVTDVFDNNRYAHDPHADFTNWAVIEGGAFDYAADAWGYTLGAAAEWNRGDWSVRGGGFAMSTRPNVTTIEWSAKQHQWIGELEHRHTLDGHPGTVRALVFQTQAEMARYDDAVARSIATGQPADPAGLRAFRHKSGYVLNVEQEIGANLGAFARWSANDGRTESFDFTDINRSVSGGLTLNGGLWSRTYDQAGVAVARNSLSSAARAFFAAGGMGILIGDGQLPHPGAEQVVEAFYNAQVVRGVHVTFDAQHFWNPAYNRDRGPVTVLGLRLHAQF